MFRTEKNGLLSSDGYQIIKALDKVGLKIIKNRNNRDVMEEAEPLVEDIINHFSLYKEDDFSKRYIVPSYYLEYYSRGCFKSDLGYFEKLSFNEDLSYLVKPLTIANHLRIKNVVTELPQANEEQDSYKTILPKEIVKLYNRESLIRTVDQLEDYNEKLEDVYENLSSYEPLSPTNYFELIESYVDKRFHDYVPLSRDHDLHEELRSRVENNPDRDAIFKDLISKFYASLRVFPNDPFSELHKLLHWWSVTYNRDLYDEEFFKRELKDYILSEDKTCNLGLLELGVYDAFEKIVQSF